MRLVYEESRDFDYLSGREILTGAELRLVCKNEQEFYMAWQRIKDIPGVVWCGCPVVLEDEYSDLVVIVERKRAMTVKDVKDEIGFMRDELNRALGLGRYSKSALNRRKRGSK